MVDVETWTAWALLAFGQAYARVAGARGRRWETLRSGWFRSVIELVVVYHLGERRTVFAWREADRHGDKLDKEEGEEPVRPCLPRFAPSSFPRTLALTRARSTGYRARPACRQGGRQAVAAPAHRDGLRRRRSRRARRRRRSARRAAARLDRLLDLCLDHVPVVTVILLLDLRAPERARLRVNESGRPSSRREREPHLAPLLHLAWPSRTRTRPSCSVEPPQRAHDQPLARTTRPFIVISRSPVLLDPCTTTPP